jgi:hypothetical protein
MLIFSRSSCSLQSAVNILLEQLPNALLPPHPDLFIRRSRFTFSLSLRSRQITQLHLPNLQLEIPSIPRSREEIKRPAVLGTRNPRTQLDTEILNVENTSLRERERRVWTLL